MMQQIPFKAIDDTLSSRARSLISKELAACSRPIVTTKFNPYSGVLLHLICSQRPDVPVVWVDTGYNTQDTHAFAQYLQALLSLNLQVYKPLSSEYVTPPDTDTHEHAEFVTRVKLEPFSRAMDCLKPDLWFSSLRSSQTIHRNALPDKEQVSASLAKTYPLLDWSDASMERYLKRHKIAKGPECYDPTKGDPKRECGLHTQRWADTVSGPAQHEQSPAPSPH